MVARDLLTSDELTAASKDVRGELQFQPAELKAELRSLEYRMTIKLGGIGTILAGLIIAAQKLL